MSFIDIPTLPFPSQPVPVIPPAVNYGGVWYGPVAPTSPGIGWQWLDTSGNLWIWELPGVWTKVNSAGAAVSPSNTNPAMDGVAAPGTSALYSRGDHVHPTDTSRAPLASPALTGTPTAPTATAGTSTNQLATTAFVTSAVGPAPPAPSNTNPTMAGAAAPGTSALYSRGDHVHPTDTSRAPLASPTFTGTPAAPTATAGTSSTQLATTAFVGAAVTAGAVSPSNANPTMAGTAAPGTSALYTRGDHVHPTDTSRAPLASPALTGTPTSPTPTAGDSSTNIATTAFVGAAITSAAVPAPSNANPTMAGAAAPGTSALYTRGDHVHPTDTSRAPLASPPLTGTPTAPTPAPGDNSTNIATTAFVNSAVAGAATASVYGGFVSKFRNPNMDVWQRGTTITIPADTNVYCVDGWRATISSAAGTATQSVGGANGQGDGRTRLGCTLQPTANGCTGLNIQQRIESYIATQLSGQVCTVSAWIAHTAGVTITPTLMVQHPTSTPDNFGTLTNDVTNVPLQPCPTGVWTRVAYTFQAATQVNGLLVLFVFGNNFATTGKYVTITECDIRATPGVAIGLNSSPPPLEYRPIGVELAYCQRYFWRSTLNSGSRWTGTIYGASNMQVYPGPFPVQMRASPSTSDSGVYSDLTLMDIASGVSMACTSGTPGAFTPQGYGYMNMAGTAGTFTPLGRPGIMYPGSAGTYWLQASAEL